MNTSYIDASATHPQKRSFTTNPEAIQSRQTAIRAFPIIATDPLTT